ncbi:MAG TPA: phage protease [Rhizomicrobium sp.]|nr:phage protease [Rhizomicrobium sp.]
MTKRSAIEIFRAGRHTAMNGKTITFTDADIAAMAKAYDRATFDAPCVVGHPTQAAPAYAWTESLSAEGGKLFASVDQVDPQFAEMVNAGRFKKISAAFYAPDDSNNPAPGSYYLQHIGFLGAAAPAVKGLKPVAFASDTKAILEFADVSDISWPLSQIATALRGVRDWLIGEKSLDVANQVIPDYLITSVEDASTQLRQAVPSPAYTEHPNPEITVKTAEQRQAELDAREAALKTREEAVTSQQTQFAEATKTARNKADADLVESLIAQGRVVPSIKAELLNFMAQLDGDKTLAFAEGADAPKLSAHAFFTDLLKKKTGKVIHFGEVSKPGNDPEALSANPETAGQEIAKRALAYIEEQKGKNIVVTISEAVDHIRKQEQE